MNNTKLKTGDNIVVIAGKDKGKKGEIMKISTIEKKGVKRVKVIVKGVNIVTKHIKASAQAAGQKIQFEKAVDASNVMILCPKTDKRTRIGYKKLENGKKERYAKISKEPLDKAKTS